ncbi:hypothetical protein SAMN04488697_11516 [Pseudomonas sp. 43mfcvi1.1]|uniref:hypothetical protein n=1 Tax=Pseudomonas TaxID=286 RepID=UPI000D6BD592|nr:MULTISPECIES: hypothetical protein [Pseudomonas]AXP01677.1 hypothetical protein DZG01_01265 [Pseudomonas fluorescens]PWJ30967.1 hypothetical protein ATJ40_11516 [Pseudomonas sp. 43mfcvi1.1]UQI32297.1 hypothetical protein M3M50_06650 [Pseudomonas bijieensis]SSB98927.1 hypothetical protein SAMN04488697_11516 [Pseudomonas sp. 43mfcvi1.1]
MSLETTIASLVTAANNLTTVVNGKIGSINTTMATALDQFNEWRSLKDVEGDPAALGTIRRNLLQGFISGTGGAQGVGAQGDFTATDLGTTANVYVHFKVPLNINVNSEMFWFNIKGYSYGTAKIIEETLVGYCYQPTRTLQNVSTFGNMTPACYVDTNGNIVMRILVPSIYYTTIRIDTMRVGNGRLFKLGDLKTKLSLAETVAFS